MSVLTGQSSPGVQPGVQSSFSLFTISAHWAEEAGKHGPTTRPCDLTQHRPETPVVLHSDEQHCPSAAKGQGACFQGQPWTEVVGGLCPPTLYLKKPRRLRIVPKVPSVWERGTWNREHRSSNTSSGRKMMTQNGTRDTLESRRSHSAVSAGRGTSLNKWPISSSRGHWAMSGDILGCPN